MGRAFPPPSGGPAQSTLDHRRVNSSRNPCCDLVASQESYALPKDLAHRVRVDDAGRIRVSGVPAGRWSVALDDRCGGKARGTVEVEVPGPEVMMSVD